MKRITIDGRRLTSRKETHAYLQSRLGLREYYGHNLDALEEALRFSSEPLRLVLTHAEDARASLGEYADRLFNLLEELHRKGHLEIEYH